jgi:hypothetical protein
MNTFEKISHFIVSLICILALPLLPIFLEHIFLGKCSTTALTMTTAIYVITVFITSNYILFIFVSMGLCAIFSSCYGYVISTNGYSDLMSLWSIIAICGVAILHTFERFYRHILCDEPFYSKIR